MQESLERERIQEIINVGYLGVIKQGYRSQDIQGNCKYRAEKGFKCVIGFSIPDEKYHPSMEGRLSKILQFYPSIFGRQISGEGVRDLRAFQECHDVHNGPDERVSEIFVNHFKWRCKVFAQSHGYTLPEIPNENDGSGKTESSRNN